jgi:outer membrane protein assembly factor BamB
VKRFRGASVAAVGFVVALAVRAEVDLADWSAFNGNGTFTPPVEGILLITAPAEARVAWEWNQPMGVQKTNKAREGEFYGGTAGVIAGDGKVFTSYIRPSGDVLNEKRVNRYYPLEKQPKTLRQIDADDVTVALDANTGKLLWQAEEKGAAMNFLFGKRGHYGVTPAYGAGRVFTWGALGKIYAYDAQTGQKQWEATAPAFHARAVATKEKALAEKTILDTYGGAALFENLRTALVVADKTLIAPDGFGGLIGFDAATGQKRWELPAVIARGATPAIWRHAGKAYLLCPHGRQNTGKITLISPSDGKVLWTHHHDGPAHTSLVIGGDKVFFNTRGNMLMGQQGPRGDPRAGSGLLACYQLTLDGPRQLWRFPDTEENRHAIRPDRGMNRRIAIRDGVGYLLLGDKQKLVTVDMESGRILHRDPQELPGTACSPVLAENRLFLPLDLAHSWDAVKIAIYGLEPAGKFTRLGEIAAAGQLKIEVVTDYEVANEMAYWKGRFFTKTRAGLACIDVRKP